MRLTSGGISLRPELTPLAGVLVTTSRSDLIVNWTAFDVSSGGTVQFQQPQELGLVPEPTTWLLTLAGMGSLWLMRKQKIRPR